MPNWVTADVSVKGPEEELDRFCAMFRNKDNDLEFSLEKFCPIPDGIEDTLIRFDGNTAAVYVWATEHKGECPSVVLLSSCSCHVSFSEAYERAEQWFEHRYEDDPFGKEGFLAAGRQALINLAEYGAVDCYNWCKNNWGTKWDVDECDIDICPEDGEKVVRIWFQTAWNFPSAAFRKLAQMFPALTFTCQYAEDDLGSNCGILTLRGDNEDFDAKSGDVNFACEITLTDPPEDEGDEEDDDY